MRHISNTVDKLERCRGLLTILIDDLQELLDEKPDRENARWVLAVVDKMLENLDDQFALEEDGGYLDDVLEQYPTWHPQVRQLQQEHRMLHEHLKEARDRLQRESRQGIVSREIFRQLTDWMNAYQNHDRRETALLQDAFTLEVGVGE